MLEKTLTRLAELAVCHPFGLALAGFSLWALHFNFRRRRMVSLIAKIPGSSGLPFIGNCLEVNVEHDEIFERIASTGYIWGRKHGFWKAWFGTRPYVFINKASSVEPILGSSKHIEKSHEYSFLQPWLGTGLLTSSGHKWHRRRKILTPAFHFKILDDFIDVFWEQSCALVMRLAGQAGGAEFNLVPYVTLCALDIVCETAMGQKVDAQNCSDSLYVKAVYELGSIIQTRQAKIWLQPNWLFKFSRSYKRHQECINILHEFSNKVIKERKEEVMKRKAKESTLTSVEETFTGRKKRLAFLDLLLDASDDGRELTDEHIREEVDTFMFEGHDTTSAAISWLLFLLGSNQDVQDRVVSELDEIFGDSDRPPKMKDLNDMKYLESCIKEALRLYPSVPIFARELNEDVKLGSYVIPAGTSTMIVAYQLHRDPEVFPNPDRFDPDNFLPDKMQARHPYAYVPFSAGPRNCIGQKFAMLEEKVVVSTILRNFKLNSVDRREDLTLLGELILRPKNGLHVQIYRRQRQNC